MNDLQASLAADEDLTVIAADTFIEKSNSLVEDEEEKRDGFDVFPKESLRPVGPELRSNTEDDYTPLKPRPMERPVTPPGETIPRGFFCGSAGDVFDTVMPLAGRSRQAPALPTSTPNPAIVEELERSQGNHIRSTAESTPTRIFPSSSHPSPSALKAGARAWREMHGRPASKMVDFRTGLSGQRGLTSASSHPHDYLDPRNSFLGYSNHSGLTMWKKVNRSAGYHGSRVSNLSTPSHGSSLVQDSDDDTFIPSLASPTDHQDNFK